MKKILIFSILFAGFLWADCVRDDQKEVVVCNDKLLGRLMWQDTYSVKSDNMNFESAKAYCNSLGLGAFGDWRLPSIEELLSIRDLNRYNPAIKGIFKNVKSSFYWSSTSYVSGSSRAWSVDFKDGSSYTYGKSNSYFVRCVR